MNRKQLKELKSLFNEVLEAPNKKEAQLPANKLEFQASCLRKEINNPYIYGKLLEAIDFAKSASGQPRDRQQSLASMNRSWYVFEGYIENQLDS